MLTILKNPDLASKNKPIAVNFSASTVYAYAYLLSF
jgi:hypothetical protein